MCTIFTMFFNWLCTDLCTVSCRNPRVFRERADAFPPAPGHESVCTGSSVHFCAPSAPTPTPVIMVLMQATEFGLDQVEDVTRFADLKRLRSNTSDDEVPRRLRPSRRTSLAGLPPPRRRSLRRPKHGFHVRLFEVPTSLHIQSRRGGSRRGECQRCGERSERQRPSQGSAFEAQPPLLTLASDRERVESVNT